MTTFTSGATVITPQVVDGFKSSRPTNTIVHDIIGTSAPAIVLQDAGLHTGTATLVFPTLEAAQSAEAQLKVAKVWTIGDTDHTGINMAFVVTENLDTELDDETRAYGVVTFTYQEVAS